MGKGQDELKSLMKGNLSDFRGTLKSDKKVQLNELSANINQKIQTATEKTEEATWHLVEDEEKYGQGRKVGFGHEGHST